MSMLSSGAQTVVYVVIFFSLYSTLFSSPLYFGGFFQTIGGDDSYDVMLRSFASFDESNRE